MQLLASCDDFRIRIRHIYIYTLTIYFCVLSTEIKDLFNYSKRCSDFLFSFEPMKVFGLSVTECLICTSISLLPLTM